MNDLNEEIAQLLAGGQAKIDGAARIVARPDCASDEADIAYSAVADGVNLITKAFLRKQGYTLLSDESAPRLLAKAMIRLQRARLPGMPSQSDLETLIYARNSSIHEGLASTSAIEAVVTVIELARAYLAVVRRASGSR